MQHYADTAAYRTEMEIVKAENENLRQRVRNLERALRARRRDSSQSDAALPELRARASSTRESGVSAREGVSLRDSTSASARESLDGRPSVTSAAGVAAWAAGDGGVGGVAGPRERSESQSTTASSRRGPVGLAVDEEVRVGESAGSAGLGRGT